jgi:hypothetical protein
LLPGPWPWGGQVFGRQTIALINQLSITSVGLKPGIEQTLEARPINPKNCQNHLYLVTTDN